MERQIEAICATCNLCEEFMPKQTKDRLLLLEPIGTSAVPKVLFLDDTPERENYDKAIRMAQLLVGPQNFTYTTTIRCSFVPDALNQVQLQTAASRCSVWTNQLLEGRAVIITTMRGMFQLKVGIDRVVGDAFKVPRLGVVLCIPSLLTLTVKDIDIYQTKIKRVLKEAGLT